MVHTHIIEHREFDIAKIILTMTWLKMVMLANHSVLNREHTDNIINKTVGGYF